MTGSDGEKYTATLTDTNNVLSDYLFSSSVPGIRFSVNGNKLTITADTAPADTVTITAEKRNSQRRGVITWTDGVFGPNGKLQDTVTYAQTVSDPVKGYLNIKVSYGSAKIVKTSEDGKVEGISFTVTGNGVNKTVQTGAGGVIQIDNLAPGVYTVTEQSYDKYEPQEVRRVTVVSGQVATVNFSNVLKRGDLTVTKSDTETGLPQGDASLAGAVYGIYKGEQLVDAYTTDANSQFTTKNYVCGDDWSVREITPGEGYLLDEAAHHIGAEAKNYTVEYNSTANDVTEQVIKGNIALIKHTDNGETQIETPEVGAEFEVFLKSAGGYAAAKDSERDYLTCDENGFAQTKDLPYGIYTVHQVKGWDGRELLPDFDVYIRENGQTYRYLANNRNFESYLKIVKVDAETGKVIPYAGAGFQLYRPDGSLITQTFTYPEVTTIDTFYTNSEGYLITPEKLEYGKGYSLVEVSAPYGYTLNGEPVYFDVTADNATEENAVTVVEVTKPNMTQKGVIKISKSGEVFSSVTEADGLYRPVFSVRGLPGAVYEIAAAEDIITPDGSIIPADGLLEILSVDENGHAACKTDLPFGSFYLKELSADGHYILSDDKYPIVFEYAGQDTALVEIKANDGKPIGNDLIYGEIHGLKKDEGGSTLGGAVIGLFKADCTEFTRENAILTAVSKEDGGFSFADVPYGNWIVWEIEAPTGFVLSDETFAVTVDKDGAVIEIEIENTRIRGTVQLTKDDKDYPDNKLTGAEFSVYRDSNGNKALDTDDELLGTLTENGIGVYEMSNLIYGGYFVKETKAPEGFYLDEHAYYFAIVEHGKTVIVENEAGKGFINAAQVGSLKIIKTSSDNKVAGFSFRVTGPDGYSEIFTTDKNGEILIENLRIGEYVVSEVSDGASAAYILPADKTASVFEGAVTKVEMHNELRDTPKTGDDSNPALWLSLLGISAVGAAVLNVIGWKKKKTEKEV